MSIITRKSFIHSVSGLAGLLSVPVILQSQQPNPTQQKAPPLDPVIVKEFVGAAHKDFNKVKDMLQENPDLLNAVNNLGGWDWEDALGAAGHVGIRDMALYLLDQGARPTICVAAMLGELKLVKSYIKAFPFMKDAVGPHKISLVRHAKAGGNEAREVLEFLKKIGAKE
jgi:hypothetical protein